LRACGGGGARHWGWRARWDRDLLAGILASESRPSDVQGPSGYQLARRSLCRARGLCGGDFAQRSATPWAPILWLLSLAAGHCRRGGIYAPSDDHRGGVAFGAGFVAAGAEMLSEKRV